MTKEFKRTIEDFRCENCGVRVKGNGYTNHCPECLWSKHVDLYPGDRGALCNGMMEPIDVIFDHGQCALIHHCRTCGYESKNKVVPEDDFEKVIAIAKKRSRNYFDM